MNTLKTSSMLITQSLKVQNKVVNLVEVRIQMQLKR